MHLFHKYENIERYEAKYFKFIVQKCSKCEEKRIFISAYETRYKKLNHSSNKAVYLYIKELNLKNLIRSKSIKDNLINNTSINKFHLFHKYENIEHYKSDDFEFFVQKCSKHRCGVTRTLVSVYGLEYRTLYGVSLHEAKKYIKETNLKNLIKDIKD